LPELARWGEPGYPLSPGDKLQTSENRNSRAVPRATFVLLLENVIMPDTGAGNGIVTPMG
jgi:hypothetical protein